MCKGKVKLHLPVLAMMVIVVLSVLLILSCWHGIARAGMYNDTNHFIDQSGIDTPIHALIGAGGSYLIYEWLPDEMPDLYKKPIAFLIPVAFALVDESFNKNFNIGDPAEVAAFSCLTLTFISIDF